MKGGGIAQRTRYSLAGLRDAWQRERAFRAHQLWALTVLGLLAVMRAEPIWWGVLVLALALGMAFEAMNGAVEALADLLEPLRCPKVRVIKDMASAAAFLANCATGLLALLMIAAEW
ncbi:diacylglycerol kinase [Altererythrobacter salegens]|uniref:Diacylglycerol kinase n=1 Tax=Croceibacterium salegens TaxID=1737568 RepID=A0A6I4SSX4_9SPHN|nr:diacylglycerol kinase [Croceibacterium salegens]MXO58639.1 diacylglycerol kinase [Croceibacterium salegens]